MHDNEFCMDHFAFVLFFSSVEVDWVKRGAKRLCVGGPITEKAFFTPSPSTIRFNYTYSLCMQINSLQNQYFSLLLLLLPSAFSPFSVDSLTHDTRWWMRYVSSPFSDDKFVPYPLINRKVGERRAPPPMMLIQNIHGWLQTLIVPRKNWKNFHRAKKKLFFFVEKKEKVFRFLYFLSSTSDTKKLSLNLDAPRTSHGTCTINGGAGTK